ncbi:LOW QUALITY PROTEIN: trafficking kinesin-binding protein 1-like [Urocitellus parryii]
MSTSLGLVWLLKERGISAAVYDPQSWDRAARGSLLHSYTPKMAVIPSTPPNSPRQTPTSSPPSFEFKCTSPPYDNFLASKPASSILREVREKKNIRSSESQTDVSVSNLNLVDKVRRFGVAKVVNSGRAHVPTLTEDQGPLLCGPPGPAQALVPGGLVPEGLPLGCPTVTSAIGGLQLSSGIRRNRSFPTMYLRVHPKSPPYPLLLSLSLFFFLQGSATLHHWQQLAQPHLGGILDPRPGVVTKGFRTLDVDLDEVYCLNDFEEDDTGDHISLPGLATSTPVQHPETSGERSRAHVTVSGSRSYPSRPQASPEEMQEMPAAKEEEEEEGSAHHPGKCMSQTNSTFTFTTCRILHPSDELTRVTPSLNSAPTPACGSTSHLKSTPVATPCTPRRLSLAESFTNIRESTTTMSTSLGLVWLLKERGISAAVYDPQSWDRAARGSLLHSYTPKMAVIPSTPPNSPMQTPTSSPPSFEFKCTSPPYDNFLASKPASSILREVREKKNVRSSESQTDVSVSNLNLVDKVRRFGVAKVVNSGRAHVPTLTEDQGPLLCGPPGPAQALVPGRVPEGLPLGCPTVTSAIGGLQLSSGIRRNRSFPTMVGSSMHMKAPVTLTSGILMGAKLPKQTSLR